MMKDQIGGEEVLCKLKNGNVVSTIPSCKNVRGRRANIITFIGKDGSLWHRDILGGLHSEGIGWNPNGVWCGECSNINCSECPSRNAVKVVSVDTPARSFELASNRFDLMKLMLGDVYDNLHWYQKAHLKLLYKTQDVFPWLTRYK